LPEQQHTRHDVSQFAWPGGQTIYGARCNRCGDAWSVRNLKLARARLAIFREEECPAPDALHAEQVVIEPYDYWAAGEAEAVTEPEERPAAPAPTPGNLRRRLVVLPLALVVVCCLLVAGGWWLSGASQPQPVAHTVTSTSTGLVEPPGFTAPASLPQGWLNRQVRKQRRWRREHPQLARLKHIESALVLKLLKRWMTMTPAEKRRNVRHYHQCLAGAKNQQDVTRCLHAAINENDA